MLNQSIQNLDHVEAGLRSAHQMIDKISAITGLPFRPAWAQPLFDGWQQSMAWIAALEGARKRIAELEAKLDMLRDALADISAGKLKESALLALVVHLTTNS